MIMYRENDETYIRSSFKTMFDVMRQNLRLKDVNFHGKMKWDELNHSSQNFTYILLT